MPSRNLSSNTLLLLVALFIAATGNLTFFTNVLHDFPVATSSVLHLVSLALSFVAVNALLFALLCVGRLVKPVLIVFLLLSSLAAYFMDSYAVVISDDMLRNVVQTQTAEAFDLLTGKLVAYFVLLGVLPAIAVARVPLRRTGWRQGLRARAALIGTLLAIIAILVAPFGGFYASFVREHKPLRTYANPTYFFYSAIKFASESFATQNAYALTVVGADAHIPESRPGRRLVVVVVGEAARADRFGLNGYARDTTPELRAAQVINFTNYWSCGTSTAVSVPCMFSTLGMDRFDLKKANHQENLLDVLQHAGVNVLWLDNNSDSKGVALRSTYQNYRVPENNPSCDEECRDEGMLVKLQDYVASQPKGDIVIVLHQMGNHGPAYFKRYPPSFEKFSPVCRNNDLSQCSNEEIGNAYDNALLYTDHFLARTIDFLKRNEPAFGTALLYMSDHGESLGENGVYLHGLPRAIAPEAQIHIPAVMWLGKGFADVDREALLRKRDTRFTHDNLVHTVLGFLQVRTAEYRPELDILDGTRTAD